MDLLDTLLQTLDDCQRFLLTQPAGSRRTAHIERIREIVTAVCDSQAVIPGEGTRSSRGGDHKFNTQILLARIINEHTGEMIAKVDAEGNFLYTNAAHYDTLGYGSRYLLQANLLDFAATGHRADLKTYLQQALTHGTAHHIACLRHADGSVRWIESQATRVKEGKIQYLLLISRDVTSRKLAEDALRASEARQRAMLRAIPDLMLQVNADGMVLEYAVTSAQPNRDGDDWAGRRIQDLIPGTGVALLAQIRDVIDTDQQSVREYTCCWPQPQEGEYEARVVVSAPGEVLVMWRDVTERKRAERAEHESRERYRQMFEESGALTLLVDPESHAIVDANPAAARYYGYARAALMTMRLDDITCLEAHRIHRTLRWFMDGRHSQFAYKHRLASGRIRHVEMHASPLELRGQRLLYCILDDITERVQEETARRMSETHLALMSEQLPAIVWTVDDQLVIQSMTGQRMEAAGLALNDTLGMSLHERYATRPDHPILTAHLRALEGDVATYDMVHNGHHFQSSVTPFRDSMGRIIGCLGISFDITDRVQLEQTLQASEQRFRMLMEQAADAILIVAPSGQPSLANDAAVTLLGYTPDELAHSDLIDLFAPDATVDLMAVTQDRTTRCEDRMRCRDGRLLPVSISARRLSDGSISMIMRDITERQRQERRYRALFERTSDAVLLVGLDRRVMAANQQAVALTGYPLDDLIGQPAACLVPPDEQPDDAARWAALIGGAAQPVHERHVVTRQGGTIPAEAHLALVPDSDGHPQHVQIIMRDISARNQAADQQRRLDQQLSKAQKLDSLGLLAGGVAHDFNNVLSAITGNISLAQRQIREGRSPPEIAPCLGDAQLATRHASEMVQQLLSYAGKGARCRHLCDINAVTADMVTMLRASLPPNARIETHYGDNLLPVEGDTGQIGQVVLDLVVNAADALQHRTGTIRLATALVEVGASDDQRIFFGTPPPPGTYVQLDVTDTGTGMDAATQARIFDPFFTTKPDGRGLGLAALFGIMRSHGGAVALTSDVGRGTSMRMYFPATPMLVVPRYYSTTLPQPQEVA